MLSSLSTLLVLAVANPGGLPELPGRTVGVLVLPGAHPWGTFYEPGFDWSWAGTEERTVHRFLTGPEALSEYAPYFAPGSEVGNAFQLHVELPHERTKYTVDMAPGAIERTARRHGVTTPVALVEVDVNDRRGGRGTHFVITNARVLDDRLDDRLRAARRAFDALVKDNDNAITRALRAAEDKTRSKLDARRILGDVPAQELVVYRPYWNAKTESVEVYFGYRKVTGVRVKTEPAPRRSSKYPPPPPVIVARSSASMGALYRLGKGVTRLEVFSPSVLEPEQAGRRVPWEDVQGRVPGPAPRERRSDDDDDGPGGTPCPEAECGPAPGMPAWRCADGTQGGNTGRCLKRGSGRCGWEIKRCAR